MDVKFKNALWQYEFMEKLLTYSLQKNRMEELMKVRNTSGKQPKVFKLADVEPGQLVTLIDNEHNRSTLRDWSANSLLDGPSYLELNHNSVFLTTAPENWDDTTCSLVRICSGYIYDMPRDTQVYVYDEPEILISNFKTEEDE